MLGGLAIGKIARTEKPGIAAKTTVGCEETIEGSVTTIYACITCKSITYTRPSSTPGADGYCVIRAGGKCHDGGVKNSTTATKTSPTTARLVGEPTTATSTAASGPPQHDKMRA